MKRIISIAAMALLLGSCQSDNTPTQSDSPDDQVGVSARLFATSALPSAQRFRARLTVGDEVGEWRDTSYDKGRELNLGKVKRGTLVVLDVRGYSVNGSDTLWKWFAHKSDSAKGAVLTIETEVKGIAIPVIVAGQVVTIPVGSWFTTDTTSWNNKSIVDSTGYIPALAGTVLRVRLRMVVPGTKDTLLGDTLRLKLPQKPSILPANRTLNVTDSVRVNGASGDSLSYCEGMGCNNWSPYKRALAPKAFVLRARAVRNGLVSSIETATFTLAPTDTTPVVPVDTVIEKPTFSLPAGTIGAKDKITISSVKAGDSIRYSTGGNWNGYTVAIMAGTFTLRAVSLRGKYVSDTAEATYVASSTKPSSPAITSSCTETSKCDPGTTVEMTADSGVKLLYAFFPDSTDWKSYTKKLTLDTTTKVFGRAVRGSDTSAAQSTTFTVIQPAEVTFAMSRRHSDTVWVKPSTTSGTIYYRRGVAKDSTEYKDTTSIPVRVLDSIFSWSVRGTAKSVETKFVAAAEVVTTDTVVKAPTFSPADQSSIGSADTIQILPTAIGDTVWYKIGSGTWTRYSSALDASNDTIHAYSRRGKYQSGTVRATYTVKANQPTIPSIIACTSDCDPGTTFKITTSDTGVVRREYALLPDSTNWKLYTDSVPLQITTTVLARVTRGSDVSAKQRKTITIAQPDTVTFVQTHRNADTVWVKLSTTSGTIKYFRSSNRKDTVSYKSGDSIPLRVFDTLSAWSKRGTASSATKTFVATAVKPSKPTISRSTNDTIALTDSITITVASGDTIQCNTGSGWNFCRGSVAPEKGGSFVISARAKRNGLISDSVTKTFHVDITQLASPKITPAIVPNMDPGTQFKITVDSGSTLEYTDDLSKAWVFAASPLVIVASKDTTIYVHAKTEKKVSLTQTFAIKIQQPDTVKFFVDSTFPDYVNLRIVPVIGDTLFYSRISKPGDIFNTKKTDSFTVAVSVNDSITIWTKRGTAEGGKKGYRCVAVAPHAPRILPSRPHVHDTTDITLEAATPGDSLFYQIGATTGTWLKNTPSIQLPTGSVTLYARAKRNGLYSKDTSAVFTVHAKPEKVKISGCETGCNPGSSVTFTTRNDYFIYWNIDNKGYEVHSNGDTIIIQDDVFVCAYADSSGHVSKDSCRNVDVTQPVPPTITAVKAFHTSTKDSASVTINATQVGDSLCVKIGSASSTCKIVTASGQTQAYGMKRSTANITLTTWTKRGTAKSAEKTYTLSRLPPPNASDTAGTYVVGKSFPFTLATASGALSGDTILLSTDGGANWSPAGSIALTASATVRARTIRKGYGTTTDSSAILAVLYNIDSLIVSKISLVVMKGATFVSKNDYGFETAPPAYYTKSVDDYVEFVTASIVLKAAGSDVEGYEVSCGNCADTAYTPLSTDGIISLKSVGLTKLRIRATTTWGFSRIHSIWISKTAPWNESIAYSSFMDDRDSAIYKTVLIGGKTWMAENLRYNGSVAGEVGILGSCYWDDDAYCREYGRLYTWADAMALSASCNTENCSTLINTPHQGVCPDGYHIPTFEEWRSLAEAAGTTDTGFLESESAPEMLRSSSAKWNTEKWPNSTIDELGFRALPAGYRYYFDSQYHEFGGRTAWWMAGNINLESGRVYSLSAKDETWNSRAGAMSMNKQSAVTIRCVK